MKQHALPSCIPQTRPYQPILSISKRATGMAVRKSSAQILEPVHERFERTIADIDRSRTVS